MRTCVYAWRPLYVLQAARPQTCTKENLLPLGLQVQMQVSVVCAYVCVCVETPIRSSGCTPPNLHQRKPSSPGAPSSDTGQCSVCVRVCMRGAPSFFRLHAPTLNPEATYMGSSSPQKPPERIKDFRQNVIFSSTV